MVINFSKLMSFPPNLTLGGSDLLREVAVTKLLGVQIQSNLKWQKNTDYICQKASKRIWLIRRLKKIGIGTDLLKDFYVKEIRPLLELSVPVWHSGLTLAQSHQIERIQRLIVSLIFSEHNFSYKVSRTLLELEPLYLKIF